jgi:hypothetical protein
VNESGKRPRSDQSQIDALRGRQREKLRRQVSAATIGTLLDLVGAGAVLKVAKAVGAIASFRDELYRMKLTAFLGEMDGVDESDRRRFAEELEADAGSREKAGAALMLLLDKLDEMDKPTIVGRIFRAALERRISFGDMKRFCMVVHRAHVPDLIALSQQAADASRIEDVFGPFFHSLGLLSVSGEDYGTLDGIGAKTWYEVNDLGKKFLDAAFPAATA